MHVLCFTCPGYGSQVFHLQPLTHHRLIASVNANCLDFLHCQVCNPDNDPNTAEATHLKVTCEQAQSAPIYPKKVFHSHQAVALAPPSVATTQTFPSRVPPARSTRRPTAPSPINGLMLLQVFSQYFGCKLH
jgi:hypothetical protein